MKKPILCIQDTFDINLSPDSSLLYLYPINKGINTDNNPVNPQKANILFSVDSPDFTLRIAEQVKKLKPSIKTIHYVAPQVWVWREHRVKKFKKFLDHILLLFNFEKKYFDKESIKNTFVGHPLLDKKNISKIDISNLISDVGLFKSLGVNCSPLIIFPQLI